jgi:hypothetical protein
MFAAARFRTPWVDDEFALTITRARQWLRENPCPDDSLGQSFTSMLGAYDEMTRATVARVMELRVVIEEHVEALARWKPGDPPSGSSPADRGARAPCERRDVARLPSDSSIL